MPASPAPRFATVIFDCDSTLSAMEGIDQLAGPLRSEIAKLTDAAMAGEIPLESVYGSRLELIRPGADALDELGARYVHKLVPDARETVAALHAEGIAVRIMSGGLRPAVLAVARELGVPAEHVAAVDIRFGDAGAYAGWDESSPLSRSGGKATALERWLPDLPRPILVVGDGQTDLEARPPADAVAGYLGVVARDPVVAGADYLVDGPSLAPVLRIALGDAQPRSPEARSLLARTPDDGWRPNRARTGAP